MAQFDAQDGRLYLVQSAVDAFVVVMIAHRLAVVTQRAEAFGRGVVVGCDRAAITIGAEVLGGVKGVGGAVAPASRLTVAIGRACRLCTVLHHLQAVRPCDTEDGVHVAALPVEVDGDNALGAWGDLCLDEAFVQKAILRTDVDDDGGSAGLYDAGDGGEGGHVGGDHLVARANIHAAQGQSDGLGTVGYAHTMADAEVVGKLTFEGLAFFPEDVPAGVEYTAQGCVDLGTDGLVFALEFVE